MDIKNNYYFKNLETIRLIYNEYWDFNLIPDKIGDYLDYATNCKNSSNYSIIDDGLVTWFDIDNNNTTIDGSYLKSLVKWTGTTITPSSGFTLDDFGLTGVDNGRTDCLSGKTLTITSADTKLFLYPVTGYTLNYQYSGCTIQPSTYIYPWSFHSGVTTTDGCLVGNTICLNGGFYQGFFKLDTKKPAPTEVPYVYCSETGYTLTSVSASTSWQILPTDFKNGWSMETWIKKENSFCSSGSTSGLTLNSVYPNNKNFFFYIGTRAENKFYNNFSGETGLKTSKGIPLSLTETLIYNDKVKGPNSGQSWFLEESITLNCSCTCQSCGYTTQEYIDPKIITGGQNWMSNNGFTMNGCCTICTGDTITTVVTGTTYSYCDELSENALGFRITDDGRIGYRKLTVTGDCLNNQYKITGTVMEEGYSEPNIIPSGDSWNHIVVTYTAGSNVKNTLPAGTLKFWVNGLVKHKVDNFIGLQLRSLNDWSDKQIGVPFNMSWGGGTQGLLETQTFNGIDYNDRNLLLQENFAGTFEGELSQLRFYEKPLNVLEVRNNFYIDCDRYCRPDTFGGAQVIQPDSEFCQECKNDPIKKVGTQEININIYAEYESGSIVCNYTAYTNTILTNDITIYSLNTLYTKTGSHIQVTPEITIKAGETFGVKEIIIDDDFSRLSGNFQINNFNYDGIDTVKVKTNTNVYIKPIVTPPPTPVINSIYYGKLNTNQFIMSGLTTFNKININDGRNMYVSLPLGTGYGYILISSNVNQPVMFRNSNEGCAGFVIPMVNLGTTTIIDTNGNSVIYNIYRTFVATRASVDVWLCD